jgi:hypothetical protein
LGGRRREIKSLAKKGAPIVAISPGLRRNQQERQGLKTFLG